MESLREFAPLPTLLAGPENVWNIELGTMISTLN